jgi:hypothetical protein
MKKNLYKNAKSQSVKFADHGTKELQAKGEVKIRKVDNDIYKQAYVINQTVIERLYHRNQITENQYEAARRLQSNYLKSRLSIDLRARNVVELTNNKNIFHDRMIDYCYLDAKKHFGQAMECFKICGDKSQFYQKLILFVIIENHYLKDLKQQSKIFKAVSLDDLQQGLDILVSYYGC